MVQASISNARDFDRVAEALIIQHPRRHLRESHKRAKEEAKVGSIAETTRTPVGLKKKGKHTGSGKSGASVYHADFTSVDNYGHDDGTVRLAGAHRAHNDPADPGSDIREGAPDYEDDEENDTFSSCYYFRSS